MAKSMVFVAALAVVLACSLVPAAYAVEGECVTYNTTATGIIKLDGPAMKNCSRCQWQCLTDAWCTDITFNGVAYTKGDLPTFNCGSLPAPYADDYFTQIKNGTIKGLAVFFDANGVVIDTQEQSCEETAQQCYYWATCTGFTFNYDLTVAKDNTNAMLSACPATPYSSPIIIQPDGNAGRRLK